ncbi:flagellar hook-associated protein FlgK [Alsobacter sp. SYSU M60028]|uniref:Flagellar hook-associated protein 1 n=1 Tax=Alsobacter ponti TaxID=2962936 RepID=A0ABT1L773_9HYPH|nr:flagellar hook-associated protein FlgK [Alsobacter ponti]MCP8937300.1 flagellar hook-associated protein FlgK [Alsobacter ponti]
MSLASALSSTLSGLRATQAQMEIISGNVANADSVGYSRRVAVLNESVADGDVNGVRLGGAQRLLDVILQRELRAESGGSGYSAARAAFADRLQLLFGTPGSSSSLDALYNAFTQSLDTLTGDPSNSLARSRVLSAAGSLADSVNAIANGIQQLRMDAEQTIGSDVQRVNELLAGIQSSDAKVRASGGKDPALLDQRDAQINELSRLIDVKVAEGADGGVTLSTQAGLTLLDASGPTKLSFDGRGTLSATSLLGAATGSGVGAIVATFPGGGTADVTGQKLIRSGEIAALLEMRDTTLVDAQAQLDEFAAGLSTALSNRAVAGAPVAGGFTVDMTGVQPGNVLTVDVTTPGGSQRYSFVAASGALPSGATADPTDIETPIDFAGGMAGAASAIQAALGAGFTVTQAGGVLTIAGAGASVVNAASASITNTGASGAGPELPLFTDGGAAYTGSFETGSQKTGLSARLRLNAGLTGQDLVVYAAGTPAGDATRPTLLRDRLASAAFAFAPVGGVGAPGAPFSGTVGAFLRRVVDQQGANAASAQRLNEGQQVVQASIESRFSKASGVSVDQELSSLVQVQNAYAANARIMSAIKEMMDVLMRL